LEKRIKAGTEKAGRNLQVTLNVEGQLSEEVNITAYAFDREGTLLASAPVKDGQVQLDLGETEARRARLLIGPSLEGRRGQPPSIASLERLHAYEPRFAYDPKKHVVELMPIPEVYWKWWIWCRCRARGKVVKPVTVGAVTADMAVCHARVHVCEVDPLWLLIPRLPDVIVDRLRHELIVAIEKPFPWPPDPGPDPIFQYDPGVVNPSPLALAKMNRVVESEATLPAVLVRNAVGTRMMIAATGSLPTPGSDVMFNPQPEPPGREAYPVSASLPMASKAALLSPSLPMAKQALLAHVDLIRPYLCIWPWIWPYLYRCDEIAVLDTDTQGRFETDIWYLCAGDHPDLYFWVEFCIGGTWTTVYHPPVRCNTYWNYACGSEVVIRVTDPRVPWCGDPPSLAGKQIAVMTIGNNVSMHEIQGVAAGVNQGLTADGRPFGGSLEPHVWFGQDDLIAGGITHYRWSYRKLDGVDGWHAMDRQVVRHYAVIGPAPLYTLTFKPFLLGPDPGFPAQNLYKIQPKDAPAGGFGWAPMVDARENTASAFLYSHLLAGGDAVAAAGKYELKMELFNNTGTLVNLTDAGVSVKVPTTDAPFGPATVPTVAAPAENLIVDGVGKVVGFKTVVHVDNNPCQASIYPTRAGGNVAGPCGFIMYPPGSDAHLWFKAKHPNNFATFSFGTYRGSSGIVPMASASGPVGASPLNGFVRSPASIFAKDIPVAALVAGCPGAQAAFAETLHVDALATDGWSILDYLDADAVTMAFALEPAGP
jgi:hypothetical protein